MNDPKRLIIVFLGLLFIGMSASGIKGHLDSNGYKKQVNYTTAIQSTQQDDFNYIVDSQQGRVLANGNFSADTKNLVKFDEMNQAFLSVTRTLEQYTMHTREDCTTDADGNTTCTTETYYTWDAVAQDFQQAPVISFMGRDYSPSLFNFSRFRHHADACAFTTAGSGDGFFSTKHGCLGGYFYLNDDDRYSYAIVPQTFNATFLATTYGGLSPFEENAITLTDKSIDQVLNDVGRYKLIGFWVLTSLLIILTIGAIYIAYAWVMADNAWRLDE